MQKEAKKLGTLQTGLSRDEFAGARGVLRMRALSRKTQNDLEVVSREIAWYDEESRKVTRLALQYRIEIGKRLSRAKEMLPHGQFLRWAHKEFGWSRRHVAYHLLIAANEKRLSYLPKETSFRMAITAAKELSSSGVESRHTSIRNESSGSPEVEVLAPPKRVYIIGEVVEGDLDCEGLLDELVHLAAAFGAPKTRWKMR
jgi:hypothetical protein